MATGYIFNGFGKYDERDGELGIWLPYAGTQFWFPYQKVTPIPAYAFREVDHAKTTPEKGEILSSAIYRNEFVDGKRIAEELTLKQIPVSNHDKGIQIIEGKPTGNSVVVFAGCSADSGAPIMAEVLEKVATKAEMDRAEASSIAYKRLVISEFFDSKRQRMTGGQGRNTPGDVTRLYMEELNVEDVDDVTAHQKSTGMSPEVVRTIMEESRKAQEINGATLLQAVETVRKQGKAQLKTKGEGKRSLGLAERKAAFEAKEKEAVVTE